MGWARVAAAEYLAVVIHQKVAVKAEPSPNFQPASSSEAGHEGERAGDLIHVQGVVARADEGAGRACRVKDGIIAGHEAAHRDFLPLQRVRLIVHDVRTREEQTPGFGMRVVQRIRQLHGRRRVARGEAALRPRLLSEGCPWRQYSQCGQRGQCGQHSCPPDALDSHKPHLLRDRAHGPFPRPAAHSSSLCLRCRTIGTVSYRRRHNQHMRKSLRRPGAEQNLFDSALFHSV